MVVALLAGVGVGVALRLACLWWGAPECRVLENDVWIVDAESDATFPVGTHAVVDRCGEYMCELSVPVRLPAGAATRACDPDERRGWL